uniref:FLYWCH-type domain-containing protein n=1 Tax=Heterorhabditis bacteriophora TaxID=37862 RepID=A0A1I7XHK4_HETBA
MDHSRVLQLAEDAAYVTKELIIDRLRWDESRAQSILDHLVKEGLAWVDKQAADSIQYWVPSLFLQQYCHSSSSMTTRVRPEHSGPPELVRIIIVIYYCCGSGVSGSVLSCANHFWVGLDISMPMLKIASHDEENEGKCDLIWKDMGTGIPFRPGSFDGAISISAIQWLCHANSSDENPKKRLHRFFETLYAALGRGARAVFQFYPENELQTELIMSQAVRAGFNGGLVVDFPNSAKAKKVYLVLMTGGIVQLPKALTAEGQMDSQTQVDNIQRRVFVTKHRERKPIKGSKAWIEKKRERMIKQGRYSIYNNTLPMAEPKGDQQFLDQLLDDVNPATTEDTSDIAENINMEDVLNALNQGHLVNTGNAASNGAKEKQFKRQRRGNRMKVRVYDNGFIFTYDKDSSCGQRSFWRCERKNECPARVHTNPLTNQIIKRIHEHTHGPPNREELPPWLLLNQDETSELQPAGVTTPPSAASTGASVGTGVLLPYPSGPNSSMQSLSHLIDQVTDKDTYSENLFTVKTELIEENGVVNNEPIRKRAKRRKEEATSNMEQFIQQPAEFWEMFDATGKIINWLAKGGRIGSTNRSISSEQECNPVVAQWLDDNRLGEYKTVFVKYNMEDLRRLSADDCRRICGNEADGLLLYHLLHTRLNFVLLLNGRVLSLVKPCNELESKVQLKLMLSFLMRFIVSSWTNNIVFQFTIVKGVCKLVQVSDHN